MSVDVSEYLNVVDYSEISEGINSPNPDVDKKLNDYMVLLSSYATQTDNINHINREDDRINIFETAKKGRRLADNAVEWATSTMLHFDHAVKLRKAQLRVDQFPLWISQVNGRIAEESKEKQALLKSTEGTIDSFIAKDSQYMNNLKYYHLLKTAVVRFEGFQGEFSITLAAINNKWRNTRSELEQYGSTGGEVEL